MQRSKVTSRTRFLSPVVFLEGESKDSCMGYWATTTRVSAFIGFSEHDDFNSETCRGSDFVHP